MNSVSDTTETSDIKLKYIVIKKERKYTKTSNQ